jgi:nitrogen fixation NifU-like protein
VSHSIYKDTLLDHYRNPRNRGDVTSTDQIQRGSNPRCGDDLQIGINFKENRIQKIIFQGRGCSVCLASASMMTEVVYGQDCRYTRQLCEIFTTWINSEDENTMPPIPEMLHAFSVVRSIRARKRCVLLAWEALEDAIFRD